MTQNEKTRKFITDYCLTELKNIKKLLNDDDIDVSIWHYRNDGVAVYAPDGSTDIMHADDDRVCDRLHLVIDGQTIIDNMESSNNWMFLHDLFVFQKGMEYAR